MKDTEPIITLKLTLDEALEIAKALEHMEQAAKQKRKE